MPPTAAFASVSIKSSDSGMANTCCCILVVLLAACVTWEPFSRSSAPREATVREAPPPPSPVPPAPTQVRRTWNPTTVVTLVHGVMRAPWALPCQKLVRQAGSALSQAKPAASALAHAFRGTFAQKEASAIRPASVVRAAYSNLHHRTLLIEHFVPFGAQLSDDTTLILAA
eukprot:407573-Prymnesium_polylepis.2